MFKNVVPTERVRLALSYDDKKIPFTTVLIHWRKNIPGSVLYDIFIAVATPANNHPSPGNSQPPHFKQKFLPLDEID